MKLFQFSLEAVLQVRTQELERARQHFAECSQWRARAAASVASTQAEIDACHEALTARREQRTSRTDQLLLLNAIQYQQSLLLRFKMELSRVERELEIRRKLMLTAQRKLDALEKLKERKKHAHEAKSQHQEDAAMDDLIAARYILQMQEVTT